VGMWAQGAAGWACQIMLNERDAWEAEIARLQADNAAVKKELLAHDLPLPGTVKPQPPAANSDEPRLQLPNDADLNKVMSFIEKVWRRFMEMIAGLQKDILKKT